MGYAVSAQKCELWHHNARSASTVARCSLLPQVAGSCQLWLCSGTSRSLRARPCISLTCLSLWTSRESLAVTWALFVYILMKSNSSVACDVFLSAAVHGACTALILEKDAAETHVVSKLTKLQSALGHYFLVSVSHPLPNGC